MEREQERALEQMALAHGGNLAVRDGFADGSIRVTLPNHAEFVVPEHGVPRRVGHNHSVDWSET